MTGFLVFLESVLLALSCSLDTFTACFAYGSKRIKIPFLSGQIIALICSAALGLSLWAGAFTRQYLPAGLVRAAAFAILFSMGMTKLLDSATKTMIRRYTETHRKRFRKELKFSLLNIRFILNLYADPEDADLDENKIISPAEAAILACSLSLDGMAVGFGAAFSSVRISAVILASLLANMAAVLTGGPLGSRLARRLPFQASWLGGVILIGLALSKL